MPAPGETLARAVSPGPQKNMQTVAAMATSASRRRAPDTFLAIRPVRILTLLCSRPADQDPRGTPERLPAVMRADPWSGAPAPAKSPSRRPDPSLSWSYSRLNCDPVNDRSETIEMDLGGLHHVTAVTTRAQENVGFYTEVLGLRLVKKTVNQDDVSAYHLFYGDELGSPGTEVTFFDWPHLRVAPNHAGAGEVSATELRVGGPDALEFWAGRLDEFGVGHGGLEERDGRSMLVFTDPEGQRLRLLDDTGASVPGGTPWGESPIPQEAGIRGLGAVELTVRELGPTAWVLTEVLGFRQTREHARDGGRGAVFEVGPGGPGAEVRVVEEPGSPPARLGRGGVHHIDRKSVV